MKKTILCLLSLLVISMFLVGCNKEGLSGEAAKIQKTTGITVKACIPTYELKLSCIGRAGYKTIISNICTGKNISPETISNCGSDVTGKLGYCKNVPPPFPWGATCLSKCKIGEVIYLCTEMFEDEDEGETDIFYKTTCHYSDTYTGNLWGTDKVKEYSGCPKGELCYCN